MILQPSRSLVRVYLLGISKVFAVMLLAALALCTGAGAAHAWYVDLSITGAGNVWEFTDADELDQHCTVFPEEGFSSPSTTPTDVLGATCRAGDVSGEYGHGWTVEYRAIPAPGYSFAGWRARTGETETSVTCDGANGSSDYSGTNCRFQIWDNLHTQARFVDTTNPQMASLNGPTGQVNGPATFTFSSTADPTFARFECRLTTGGNSQLHDWQTCSSGIQKDPAAAGTEGSYSLYVRAVDRSNNTSAPSARGWFADKIRPETTLATSGPSGTTPNRNASFEFSSPSGDVDSYVCSLEGVEVPCGSPKEYSDLNDGTYTFSVRARDDAGNEDSTPATRNWTVDGTPPETTITNGPGQGSTTQSTGATFEFSSNESGSFECQLDGTGFSACESARSYTNLSPGAHTFEVRARDAAANADGSPAVRTWTVEQQQQQQQETPAAPAPTAPASVLVDSSGPSFTFRAARGQRALKSRSLALTAAPNEACVLSALASLGRVRLGRLTRSLAANAQATLKLKIGKKGLAALRKALRRRKSVSVKLSLRCVDAALNATTVTKRISVKR
jgi:hypothetical protein